MKITLSGNMMRFTSYQQHVEVAAPTVHHAVQELISRYPELRASGYLNPGAPRSLRAAMRFGGV